VSDIRIGYGQGTVPLIFPLDGDNMCDIPTVNRNIIYILPNLNHLNATELYEC